MIDTFICVYMLFILMLCESVAVNFWIFVFVKVVNCVCSLDLNVCNDFLIELSWFYGFLCISVACLYRFWLNWVDALDLYVFLLLICIGVLLNLFIGDFVSDYMCDHSLCDTCCLNEWLFVFRVGGSGCKRLVLFVVWFICMFYGSVDV